MNEEEICDNLLKEATTEEEYNFIWNNIPKVIEDPKHSIICMSEVIGSAEFYYYCSKLTRYKDKNTIIVDCGSCIPIWQYFFKGFKKYIAIDDNCDFKSFVNPLPNSEFISGRIENVLPELIKKYGNDNIVGISRLCISYFGGKALEEFNKLKYKITL